MARLIGPDESVRVVYLASGTNKGKALAQGLSVPLYADAGLAIAADVLSITDGVIAGTPPTLTVDAYSKIPLFKFPNGVDIVYTSINGGPSVALYARTDERLDTLESTSATVTGLGAEVAARISGDATVTATANATFSRPVDSVSARGAVTISWDDAWLEWYTVLLPRLRDNHPTQRHTFCITPGLLNDPLTMSTAQAQALGAGLPHCEIASHSQTHPNLLTLTSEQRVVEYEQSRANLKTIFPDRLITTFTYPFGGSGSSSVTHKELWARGYDRVVNANNWNATTPLDKRLGVFVVPRSEAWISSSHQEMLAWVRMAAAQPLIVNLYSHRAGTDITLNQLDELLTLCDTLGVPVINLRDAYPAGGLIINPGAEDGELHWRTATGGTGKTFNVVTDTPDVGMAGTKSFHLTSTDPTGFIYLDQVVSATENLPYTFSGRVRQTYISGTSGYVRLRLQPQNRDGASIGSRFETSDVVPGGAWGQYSVEGIMPAGTRFARLDMIMLNQQGEAWFDHMHFGVTGDGVFG